MELNSQEIEVKDMEIAKLFDRNELRRLEKAAREKDRTKLIEWGKAFEQRVIDLYEKEYIDILQHSINNFIIVMIFSLHFNEKTKFGKKRIDDFMEDFIEVVNGFTRGEFNPQEYEEMLNKDKIYLKKIEE
ncbi:MAG: hypothetical protein IKF38_04925 [Clostridia bacterium]|nr:hypothetical protein [Clostridia bacterium]